MEFHGIHTRDGLKEIKCPDCGHSFLIAQGQSGGTCTACGNILFQSRDAANASSGVGALSREIVEKRVLPRLDPLAAFRAPVHGALVEEIRIAYQVEWQLWSALIQNFQDPAYHMAYLCQAIAAWALEKATSRYSEHRAVMSLVEDSRWQAEVADLMLARIENISVARLAASAERPGFRLPDWLLLLPLRSRAMQVAWLAMGVFLVARLVLALF